jgi:tryptophanyl-tRNA synthetase|tara:strand:- start:3248 stop:3496 length:249 start_codon:yes stop_codon:yes gene_type:complete
MSLHYKTDQGIEVIDVVQAYRLNFNRGNIIKYVCRAGKKGYEYLKSNEIQDLEKALDYLQHEIKYLREEQSRVIKSREKQDK